MRTLRTCPGDARRLLFCLSGCGEFAAAAGTRAGLHIAPLRHLIHLLKYEERPDLAPDLARYLAATLAGPDWQLLWPQIDALAPVPLHAERRRERGYDQAELLANGLSSRTRIPLRLDLVERTRRTPGQVGLNAAQRQANMRNAFAAKGSCPGLHVLLIDDVYTTGATMEHAPTPCSTPAQPGSAASPLPCQVRRRTTTHDEHQIMNYAIPVGLIDLIRQSRHIPLASHVYADGDAYGSVLGMKLMLDALGKRDPRRHARSCA